MKKKSLGRLAFVVGVMVEDPEEVMMPVAEVVAVAEGVGLAVLVAEPVAERVSVEVAAVVEVADADAVADTVAGWVCVPVAVGKLSF